MTRHYDETPLTEAEKLLVSQNHILTRVKHLLTKVSNSPAKYITSKESVLKMGFTKTEVKEIIDAFEENEPIVNKIEQYKKKFELGINRSYNEQKAQLESQLKNLKHESDVAMKRFPRGNSSIMGPGPYEHLKEAYK